MTPKQREALDFITEHWKVNRVCPSYDEIRVGIGLKSKSGVNRLVRELCERGFLSRLPNQPRSLQVIQTDPSASLNDYLREYGATAMLRHAAAFCDASARHDQSIVIRDAIQRMPG